MSFSLFCLSLVLSSANMAHNMPSNKIEQFFEIFNRNNSIELRVMRMLLETLTIADEVEGIFSFMEHEGINQENLAGFRNSKQNQRERREENGKWIGTRITSKDVEEYQRRMEYTESIEKQNKRIKINDKINGVEIYYNKTNQVKNNGIIDVNRILHDNLYIPGSKNEEKDKLVDPSGLFPPLQCKLCGLRYPQRLNDKLELHIEEHRRKTNSLDDKTILRREFFTMATEKMINKLELSLDGEPELQQWSGETPNCAVCGDEVDLKWNDEIESWILEDGVIVGKEEAAHRECVL